MSDVVEYKHIDFLQIEKHVDSAISDLRRIQNAGKYPKKVCGAVMYGANMLGAQKNITSSCRGEISALTETLRLKELENQQLAQDKAELVEALKAVVIQFDFDTNNEYEYLIIKEAKELLEKHK